jgi:hypothetical protein
MALHAAYVLTRLLGGCYSFLRTKTKASTSLALHSFFIYKASWQVEANHQGGSKPYIEAV